MDFETNNLKIDAYKREFAKYNRRRKAFFRAYFKYYHRFEVVGLENIPDGPALIATNHGGGFDLDIVALSNCTHPTRDIHSLVAESWHFLNHWWGRYYVGESIPLWTKGGIRFEYVDPYLEESGEHFPSLVAIYPEGHSGLFKNRHVLNPFFPGVVRVALRYKVPIVPVAMMGFHKAAPIFAEIERDHGPNDIIFPPFTFPAKLKADFGPAFELDEYYDRKLTRAEEFWVANEIVRPKLAAILEKHGNVALGKVDFEMKKPVGK